MGPWADDDSDDAAEGSEDEEEVIPKYNEETTAPLEITKSHGVYNYGKRLPRLRDGRRTYNINVRSWSEAEVELMWLCLARWGVDLGRNRTEARNYILT